jgi:hypothetical protein
MGLCCNWANGKAFNGLDGVRPEQWVSGAIDRHNGRLFDI